MKRWLSLSSMVLVLAIAVAPVVAQHTGHTGHAGGDATMPSMPHVTSGKTKGQVVEFDKTALMVKAEGRKGSTQPATFQIVENTKVKGELAGGADVVVKWTEQNGVKVAKSIEVKKRKPSKG